MEMAISAILGEIVHRSMSFFIDKFSTEETACLLPSDETLSRKLMRIRLIVEEAEARQITNQAMLQQLKALQAGMYRGYYALDTFRYRARQEEGGHHGAVSNSFALSKFNPAKRIHLCGGRSNSSGREKEQLHQLIISLEAIIADASEFIVFLNGCPALYRRIYSMYLIAEKCMFGRHVEMEYVVNFLMQNEGSPGARNLDVLPIVGPEKAGKSTLVEHTCSDERVRAAFARIVFLTQDDLNQKAFDDDDRVKYQSHDASHRDGRVLVIVEVNGDIDEATWGSLYSSSKSYVTNGSKIIVCSRSNEVARFGTTRPLKVEHLTQEGYWYFFKALAFGSANPSEEPRLASIAMEIAAGMNGSFIAANIMASMLRANFSVRFWRMALSWLKELRQRYGYIYGAHPTFSPWRRAKQSYIRRLYSPHEYCWIFNDYQRDSACNEATQTQEITIEEVLLGGVIPYGKYNVLAWRSSIPPHSCYLYSCEIRKAPEIDVQKKYATNTSR